MSGEEAFSGKVQHETNALCRGQEDDIQPSSFANRAFSDSKGRRRRRLRFQFTPARKKGSRNGAIVLRFGFKSNLVLLTMELHPCDDFSDGDGSWSSQK